MNQENITESLAGLTYDQLHCIANGLRLRRAVLEGTLVDPQQKITEFGSPAQRKELLDETMELLHCFRDEIYQRDCDEEYMREEELYALDMHEMYNND